MKRFTLFFSFLAVIAVGAAQSPHYDSLLTQARAYFQQQEYQKSNACYEQLVKELDKAGNTKLSLSMREFIAINDIYLGEEALSEEDFSNAKSYFEKALENSQPGSKVYYSAQSWMGNWYGIQASNIRMSYGDLKEALSLCQEAEKHYDLAQKPKKRLWQQITRAAILTDLSRNKEAEIMLNKVIQECEGNDSRKELLCRALFQLGNIELNNEQYKKSILHLEQCYNLYDPEWPTYPKLAANNLHSLYTYQIPNAQNAQLWEENAKRIDSENDFGPYVKKYEKASSLILDKGNYAEGLAILNDLIAECENTPLYPPLHLKSYYQLRAFCHQLQQEYDLSVKDYRKALSLIVEAGEAGKADLADMWYRISIPYYYLNKPDLTMSAAKSCIDASLHYYGPMHSETLKAYSLRSNYAGFYHLRDTALNDRQKCFEIIKKNIESNFAYLTATERSAYWNKFLDETTIMFTFAHRLEEFQSDYTDDLFNQQLMAKGLLLNAESSLQRAIESNPELKSTYQKIRALRKKIEAKDVNPIEAEAAMREADRLERSLGSDANSIYQFLDFLKVNTKNIRSKLKSNEIAIEFANYRVGKDSVMYAALILSPQWQHVRFLPLIEERDLTSNQGNISEKIWKPLMSIVPQGTNTLYFAPTGLLYQLPIESQKLSDGRFISDVFRLYRLSSTRWLAFSGDQTQGKDAVVYGGLQYDASVKEMLADAQQYPRQRSAEPSSDALRWGMKGLKYLPGTKTEANNIVETINQAGKQDFHAKAFLGTDGTEASFKALDGKQTRTIHIATHGFYQKGKSDDNDLNSALTRNGLFFAGADNKCQGEPLPEGIDDGILTAEEISRLDLRGLDLVVLSACQTGQGEVSADGVFGLQRGFKKAGAHSIIMSLWKVDDNATQLLMTEFYKHWMAGMSKHDALEKAKQTVRSHGEKGWNDPKYWAAFILLDGME